MKQSRAIFVLVALICGVAVVAALAGGPAFAAASKKAIDPTAEVMLKQMTDFVAGLKSFTVNSFAVDENTLTSGQKLQRTTDSEIAVQRPDRLRSMPMGAAEGLALWYDGKTMTLTCKANNTFKTVPAPPALDAAIDSMRKTFKIDAPGADLLYSHPYDILMEQVQKGRFIGRETVGGLPANHLAFEGEEVDWQIWIHDGNQPVPLRFVITTKTIKGHPQFSVQFSNWQTRVTLPASTFQFQAPAGATAVASVATTTCGAP